MDLARLHDPRRGVQRLRAIKSPIGRYRLNLVATFVIVSNGTAITRSPPWLLTMIVHCSVVFVPGSDLSREQHKAVLSAEAHRRQGFAYSRCPSDAGGLPLGVQRCAAAQIAKLRNFAKWRCAPYQSARIAGGETGRPEASSPPETQWRWQPYCVAWTTKGICAARRRFQTMAKASRLPCGTDRIHARARPAGLGDDSKQPRGRTLEVG